jgi:hypothetical protein
MTYQTNPVPADEDEDDEGRGWWQFMLYGIALFGFAIWLFTYLSDKEQEGGRIRIQWMVALVYDVLGKWGVVGILAGLGVVSILVGTWQLVGRIRARA